MAGQSVNWHWRRASSTTTGARPNETKKRDAKPRKKCLSIAGEAVVTYVFDKPERLEGVLAEINTAMGGKLEPLTKAGELSGKSLEMVLVHYPQGLKSQRLLLVGSGKADKFVTGDLRKIAGSALRYLKSRG